MMRFKLGKKKAAENPIDGEIPIDHSKNPIADSAPTKKEWDC
jgi:hypothetical protein